MGVKPLKTTVNALLTDAKFPSPCGVMGVKLQEIVSIQYTVLKKFPSPCGVMGVKLESQDHAEKAFKDCFRPLAG